MVECSRCKNNTLKRVVLQRKPLKDITKDMPPHPQVKQEFLCVNIVNFRKGHKINDEFRWSKETCDNHVIIQILPKEYVEKEVEHKGVYKNTNISFI